MNEKGKLIIIGHEVDTNRTVGDVTIPSGVNYEIEFTHNINISGGFEVEQGATFETRNEGCEL